MRQQKGPDELIGRVAMIHPNLTTDPADMRGEVGRIIEDNGDSLKVEFLGGIKGKYSYEGVLVLAAYNRMLNYLLTYYNEIREPDKRGVLQAMKLQSEGREVQALTLLASFPNAILHCTDFCSELKERSKTVTQKPKGHRL